MVRLLVATCLLATVAWPAGAPRAEPIGVVVVSAAAHPAGAPALAVAADRALVGVGDEGVALAPRARQRRANGAVPAVRLAEFARAERLRDEGWQAYLEVRSEFAASRLAEARTAAAGLADLDGGRELIAEISLRTGAVRLALGRDAEAARDFRLAHALAPDRAVTDAEFKPAVVAAYDAARTGAVDRRRVRLTSSPVGAAIELDGVAVGQAPVELEVEVGLHVVVARAARWSTLSQLALVDGSAVDLVLEPDPAAAVADDLAAGTAEDAATRVVAVQAGYGEVDGVLLVGSAWRRGQPAVIAQYCATGADQPRCGGVVEVGYGEPAALDRAVAAALADARAATRRFPVTLPADGRIRAGELAPGERPRVIAGRPWWRSGWLWLGISGVALGAASAWLLAGDDTVRPVLAGDPCDFAGC